MKLDFDFWILLNNLMELFSAQREHVTIGQGLCGEDGGEQLLVIANVLC